MPLRTCLEHLRLHRTPPHWCNPSWKTGTGDRRKTALMIIELEAEDLESRQRSTGRAALDEGEV
jgi:hypothetical protein